MDDHVNGKGDHRGADDGACNRVHHQTERLVVGRGEMGNHCRLQTQQGHGCCNKIQRPCGRQNGTSQPLRAVLGPSQPAVADEIDDGKNHHVKGVRRRQVDHVARIGKSGIGKDHQRCHAAHRKIEQKEQPRRFAVATVFIQLPAFGGKGQRFPVAEDQIQPQDPKEQVVSRHGKKPDRRILDAVYRAENNVKKIGSHALPDVDLSPERRVGEHILRKVGGALSFDRQTVLPDVFFYGPDSADQLYGGNDPDGQGVRRQNVKDVCRRTLRAACHKDPYQEGKYCRRDEKQDPFRREEQFL